ncbi:hypothetical protein Rhopal_004289-T1 [Rhodotorula paludigena]|uniref:Uncharacterized protein n=1 Tax=Rhodotorula paludigena TaxID=86838 RepID=A0AAV5GN05_9BASI|nr:hypothetical protein Rhopal_004289-T1 [Rhodotorula paludigena]
MHWEDKAMFNDNKHPLRNCSAWTNVRKLLEPGALVLLANLDRATHCLENFDLLVQDISVQDIVDAGATLWLQSSLALPGNEQTSNAKSKVKKNDSTTSKWTLIAPKVVPRAHQHLPRAPTLSALVEERINLASGFLMGLRSSSAQGSTKLVVPAQLIPVGKVWGIGLLINLAYMYKANLEQHLDAAINITVLTYSFGP